MSGFEGASAPSNPDMNGLSLAVLAVFVDDRQHFPDGPVEIVVDHHVVGFGEPPFSPKA